MTLTNLQKAIKKMAIRGASAGLVGGAVLAWVGSVFAATPSLFATHLGTNLSAGSPPWSHTVSASSGQFVQLYAEVGTHVSDAAENVTVKFGLPGDNSGSGSTTVSASSTTSGVSERSDSVTWNFGGSSCHLFFVPGSASAKVDTNRDGTAESEGPIADSIVSSGVNFGTFTNGVVQATFKARVECAGPAASPSPTPAPSTGGQNQGQDQSQSQNNQQTTNVNVSNTNANTNTINLTAAAGAKEKAKVPTKQPETGLPLGMAVATFASLPLGFWLRRFGHGTSIIEENESLTGQFLASLVQERKSKIN